MVTSSAVVGSSAIRKFWPAGERHRDHDALAHPARKLVGIGAGSALGVRNTDLGQKLDDAPLALGALEVEVDVKRFADLEADGETGIERRHRLLENHRDVFAGDPPPLTCGHRQEIHSVEGHAVGGHGCGRRQKAHRRQHRHRLAGAGFADDREHFVAIEGEIEPVHCSERAVPGGERDAEVADFKKRRRHQALRIFG